MTDREKLIELIGSIQLHGYMERRDESSVGVWSTPNERLADYLIANGFRLESKTSDKTSDSKWISAKDKLPPDVQRVLVHTTRGCQFVATYCHLYNHWQCARNIHITHWMPLPEPPEV